MLGRSGSFDDIGKGFFVCVDRRCCRVWDRSRLLFRTNIDCFIVCFGLLLLGTLLGLSIGWFIMLCGILLLGLCFARFVPCAGSGCSLLLFL